MAKNKTKLPQQFPQKQNIVPESFATPTTSKIANESIITKYAFSIFLTAIFLTGFFIFKDYLLG